MTIYSNTPLFINAPESPPTNSKHPPIAALTQLMSMNRFIPPSIHLSIHPPTDSSIHPFLLINNCMYVCMYVCIYISPTNAEHPAIAALAQVISMTRYSHPSIYSSIHPFLLISNYMYTMPRYPKAQLTMPSTRPLLP